MQPSQCRTVQSSEKEPLEMYEETGSASAKDTVHQRDLSAQGFSRPCLIAVKEEVQNLTCGSFRKNPTMPKNVNPQSSEPLLLNKMCSDFPGCAQGCTIAQGRTPSSVVGTMTPCCCQCFKVILSNQITV